MTYWTWLVLGLVLMALELLAPFTFFLWLGVSALVTALVAYLAPAVAGTWQSQLLIFSVLSVFSIWISRRYLVTRQTKSELPHLNRRAQQYVGRVFTLTEAIENGYGKISVDDTRWQVKGPALPKGASVKAIGADGSVLTVVAVE